MPFWTMLSLKPRRTARFALGLMGGLCRSDLGQRNPRHLNDKPTEILANIGGLWCTDHCFSREPASIKQEARIRHIVTRLNCWRDVNNYPSYKRHPLANRPHSS